MKRQNINKQKKGQQALEYLITYGWAFIVILVMISAFAYFGLFNPTKYLPSRCDFGSQLICVDYQLQAETLPDPGFVRLRFQNAFAENIRIYEVSTIDGNGIFKFDDGSDIESPAFFGESFLNITEGSVNDDFAVVLDLTGTEFTLVDGDKVLIPIIINFTRDSDGAPYHTVIGEVFAKVQPPKP